MSLEWWVINSLGIEEKQPNCLIHFMSLISVIFRCACVFLLRTYVKVLVISYSF